MSAALHIARFKVSTKALDVFSLEIGSSGVRAQHPRPVSRR